MAAPTFVHDLTTITDGETVTGWTILSGMIALDPDNKVQSANSIGFPATLNTLCGGYFTMAGDVDLTGKHLFIWVFVAQPGAVASVAAGGVRVRVAGATATNFGEWVVGGNDAPWVSDGKWRLVVIDPSRPFDFTGGTPPNINAIRNVGVTYLARITLMFGFGLNIDIMRYGTKVAVEGGSDADPITLQSIYDADFVGDPVNNVFGLVTKNRSGVFEINGELRIGDESGAANTVFSTQGESIFFQDQPCALDYLKILAQEDTGTTKIKFGVGTGAGDARVGLSGSVVDRINGLHGREYSLDLNAPGLTLVELFGTSILRAKRGVQLPAAAGHEGVSTTFAACGQVDIGQAALRKCIYTGHGRADTGAADLDVTASAVTTGTITVNANVANTYTRTAGGSGSYITDGFEVGMVVLMAGFTNATNNGRKRILTLTATVMTVEASQTMVTETGTGDEVIRVEFAFTRASGSFITDGFTAGMAIDVSDFSTAANNMSRVVTNVQATKLFVRHDLTMAAESGSGNERIKQAGIDGIGALLWNESIDIKSTSFLGNTNTLVTAAAIEHPVATSSPYTYDALTFSGNDFDINNTSTAVDTGSITITVAATAGTLTRSAGSFTTDGFTSGMTITASGFTNPGNNFETKTIDTITGGGTIITVTDNSDLVDETGDGDERVQGNVTINLTNGSDASTSKGQPVTFLSAVSLEIRVKDTANDPINLAQTAIFRVSDNAQLMNEDTNASGVAQAGYTGAFGGIYIRVRKSSTGDTKYIPFSTTGTISGDFTLDVTLQEDTNA